MERPSDHHGGCYFCVASPWIEYQHGLSALPRAACMDALIKDISCP